MIRNIAITVLLAAFVEMLMPGEEMSRYVRLVMGLFVIVALLHPVVDYLAGDLTFEVSAWNLSTSYGNDLGTILARGERLQQQNRETALSEYKKRLERQIQALTLLVRGVREAEVEVVIERDIERGLGRIKKVTVWATLGPENQQEASGAEQPMRMHAGSSQSSKSSGSLTLVPPVEPVRIRVGTNEEEKYQEKTLSEPEPLKLKKVKEEIISTISSFYNLLPEQVNVVLMEERRG